MLSGLLPALTGISFQSSSVCPETNFRAIYCCSTPALSLRCRFVGVGFQPLVRRIFPQPGVCLKRTSPLRVPVSGRDEPFLFPTGLCLRPVNLRCLSVCVIANLFLGLLSSRDLHPEKPIYRCSPQSETCFLSAFFRFENRFPADFLLIPSRLANGPVYLPLLLCRNIAIAVQMNLRKISHFTRRYHDLPLVWRTIPLADGLCGLCFPAFFLSEPAFASIFVKVYGHEPILADSFSNHLHAFLLLFTCPKTGIRQISGL